ncbi:MAG: hypothetical protein ABI653_03635 [Bacteroidota bacterium]
MKNYKSIIKGDYLQRTRSYAFLITIAISLFLAYTFVPAPGAGYTTVKIGKYVGENNTAWIGYVTAMMTSIFLSLIGFYLINNSIKKDTDTGVGMIIATTQVSNFKYLFIKVLSNFLLLLTITGLVSIMGIALVLVRSNSAAFDIIQFVVPYLLSTIPCIFVISTLAVLAETFLHKWPMLQYIGFFFLFGLITANVLQGAGSTIKILMDPFGVKMVMTGMENLVRQQYDANATVGSVGFNLSPSQETTTFLFQGIPWSALYIISRLMWIGLSIVAIFIASKFFHRFDVKEKIRSSKKKINITESNEVTKILHEIKLSSLPAIQTDYGILPFIKTELLMLFRNGPKWLWLVNIGCMIAMIFVPIKIAHQIILPVLWFLQVGRWSDLATKEKTNRIHYFTYAAYRPLERLLTSQIIAGIIIAIALASPLMIRYLLSGDVMPVLYIFTGGVFIVALAVCLGILSGGKKLFEILFFAITYSNLNLLPITDYFGALGNNKSLILTLLLIIAGLIFISFAKRKYEIAHG